MDIGMRIKKKREELGYSQEELANLVGYKSRSTINKIEKGVNDITQTKIIEFANALKTTPAFLMGWEDDLLEYVAEEDKDTVKHFMKYNPYDLDMTDEEMSIKKLLNTFGYDLSHNESGYFIIDDYGAFIIENDELTSLLNETKKYLQFNIDKMRKERRNK